MPVRANIDLLLWESAFFGRSMGQILFDVDALVLTPVVLDTFALVQAKVATQDKKQLNALRVIGFRPVVGEADCCYTLSTLPTSSETVASSLSAVTALTAVKMRLATAADITAVRELAANTLEMSRFRPPWFNDGERRRFYAQWAENAVRGSFDHLCLLAEGPDGIEGLVTLRQLRRDVARIGLLAVTPAVRRRGIGQLLYNAALNWCYQHHLRHLWVATQTSNLPALRLYLASGATLTHASCWLYRGPHDSI